MHYHGAVEVGTRDDRDVITWLRRNVRAEDFVALKFDVDAGNEGSRQRGGLGIRDARRYI